MNEEIKRLNAKAVQYPKLLNKVLDEVKKAIELYLVKDKQKTKKS